MSVKWIIYFLVLLMILALFSALYFMVKDGESKNRMVMALSARIGIWVLLLIFLVGGIFSGYITPSESLKQAYFFKHFYSQNPSHDP